jgi:hypothetical protein
VDKVKKKFNLKDQDYAPLVFQPLQAEALPSFVNERQILIKG